VKQQLGKNIIRITLETTNPKRKRPLTVFCIVYLLENGKLRINGEECQVYYESEIALIKRRIRSLGSQKRQES